MRTERLRLNASLYSRESLQAAARALGPKTEVRLAKKGGRYEVALRSDREGAAGEFLNEALNHLYRQKILRFNRDAIQPVLSEALKYCFPAMPHDPLERLEPQVAEDRRQDLEELLEAARRLGGESR